MNLFNNARHQGHVLLNGVALLLLFCVIGTANAFAQQKTITGTVSDATGLPVIGASVLVKGTSTGAVTDVDGKYSLRIQEGATLEVSCMGYITKTIIVGESQTIDVVLNEDTETLQEVVLVGYGTQKKEAVAGAISSVKGEKLTKSAAFDVSNALNGQLSGTQIRQTTGEPGNDIAQINVRGRSSFGKKADLGPLIVIDGIPDRSLYEIDPNDIANVSLLKDASAAIYGSRAANGVILITTKNGGEHKPTVNMQYTQGFSKPTIMPEAANAPEYARYVSDLQDYEGVARLYSDDDIALYESGADPWQHPNTNWMKSLVRNWTHNERYNVSVNGGTEKMHYFISGGYKNESGIYSHSSTTYKQYNFRAKFDVKLLKDWVKVTAQYSGLYSKKKYPTIDVSQLFGWASMVVPTVADYWPTGEPGPAFEGGVNPVVNTSYAAGYRKTDSHKDQTNFQLDITPPMIKGLTISGSFNYDVDHINYKEFNKPWTLYTLDVANSKKGSNGYITNEGAVLIPSKNGYDNPQLNQKNNYIKKYTYTASANYGRTFGNHNFNVFAAYEQYNDLDSDFSAFRKYFVSDLIEILNAGGEKDKNNSGTESIYARKSFIGRLNYNYKEKYLFEFIFRRDGSLKFPSNERWGNFPAVLLAWRASEEPFWKNNLSAIDYFKLRFTAGKMGMDPGDPFQYVNKFALASGPTFGANKNVMTRIYQSVVANPNITWETQTTYNWGFDSKFLKNMLWLNTEFFYNKRRDILITRNASVPNFTGLTLPDENIGKVDNRGFEVEGGFTKQFGNLNVDISGNLSWSRNKVVFMDEPAQSVEWQKQTGHPYGSALVYKAIGVFHTQDEVDNYPHWEGAKPGDLIFEDVSKDGKINSDDRIYLHKTDAPELFYGINVNLSWKNWALSILGQGQGTFYVSAVYGNRGTGMNVFKWMTKDYWTPKNNMSNNPRPWSRADQYWTYNSHNNTYWYDNMAYFRLKNITLSYSLPKPLLEKFNISGATIMLTGYNVALLYSAQRHYDPETANPQGYPAMKNYSIGLNITF